MRAITPHGRRCPCGALTDPGTDRCRKCRARARWHRRKAHHDGL
ncbi:hypothetical protein [Planobispora takensis]|uniref:Uncharacterized protein n=1 Tax=Planobispora takensis TaxID=1367882 RepID=A0A8J3SZX8_9ACTN|nr:hypothetical protein [Planobispora takensis]GII01773.1 hypothetical protein Pta02_37810 [Planobispora takensis]